MSIHVHEFPAWVRAERKRQGMSQTTLARLSGLDHGQTVTKIEGEKRGVSLSDAVALVNALGCDLPDFHPVAPAVCTSCHSDPPAGFTCNDCGATSPAPAPTVSGRPPDDTPG